MHEQESTYLMNNTSTNRLNNRPGQTFGYVRKSMKEFLSGIGMSKLERNVHTDSPDTSFNGVSILDTNTHMSCVFPDDCSNKSSSFDSLSETSFNQDDPWLVERERLKLGRILGNGTCGQVYKAELLAWGRDTDGSVVAAKCINSVLATSQSLCDLKREFSILKTLNHEKIVKIIGLVEEPIILIIEYMPYGSLDSYLKLCKGPLNSVPLVLFAMDIASAMEYLESRDIVHRDLAARNVLVESPSSVKLSDFGLAQFMDPHANYYEMKTKDRKLPLLWCSPETLRDWRFTSKSDVWSFGILLWEMHSKGDIPRYPKSDKTLPDLLESGVRLLTPQECPSAVRQVMQNCWKYDPNDRCSFADLRLELRNIQQHRGCASENV